MEVAELFGHFSLGARMFPLQESRATLRETKSILLEPRKGLREPKSILLEPREALRESKSILLEPRKALRESKSILLYFTQYDFVQVHIFPAGESYQ
jgi:hypothetical protein